MRAFSSRHVQLDVRCRMLMRMRVHTLNEDAIPREDDRTRRRAGSPRLVRSKVLIRDIPLRGQQTVEW